MAARIARVKAMLPSLESALQAFTSSSISFRVIKTIPAASSSAVDIDHAGSRIAADPRTLFILDSSYNPPSRAHVALASATISTSSEARPYRLLLLFSTHNADKAPSPASFTQRLAMMILSAEDLQMASPTDMRVPIDIGLTTAPYYTDKSRAIMTQEPVAYPSQPTHVHLLGYDTLIRFLAPKYYKGYDPPLSALAPFFDVGHKLLVLLRPDSSSDNAVTSEPIEAQRAFIEKLAEGSLAGEGMQPAWAHQIGLLEGPAVNEAVGISSSAIRKAVREHDWTSVERMCTPGVVEWIKDQKLYSSDDR
ncbi:uncharacterized protein PV09_03889 [Verruconis gallopava]|uniref:Nicotinamide-nucleotide adenylyltransferase n=1 Tax=Verruconis gallopava TaxID=253628 RepID=A0A0D2AEF0_9PEZI|nr:uncharacterized protein PV09_03889 [Verruconis gallopava]KIW05373.1 hypothetical protein PV09_03889 [Verruconis gallopava]